MKIGSSYLQKFAELSQFAQKRNDDGVLDGESSNPDKVVIRGNDDSYNSGSIDMHLNASLNDGEVTSLETFRKGTSASNAKGKLGSHHSDWFPEEVTTKFEDRGDTLAVKEVWLRGGRNGWKSDERPANGLERTFVVDKQSHQVSQLKETPVTEMLKGFNDSRKAMNELGSTLRRLSSLSTDEFDAMKNRVVRTYAEDTDTNLTLNIPGPQLVTTDEPEKVKKELFELAKSTDDDVIEVDLKGLEDSKALERGLWGENHDVVIFENFDQASKRVQNKLSKIVKENDYSPWFLLAEPNAKSVRGFSKTDLF